MARGRAEQPAATETMRDVPLRSAVFPALRLNPGGDRLLTLAHPCNQPTTYDTLVKQTGLTSREVAERLGIPLHVGATVQVDECRLRAVATNLSARLAETRTTFTWSDPRFWNSESPPRERSQFFSVGNSINFRFWQVLNGQLIPASGVIEGERFAGALYMWRCLRRCLDCHLEPILDPEFLASITPRQFDTVFTDDHGQNPLAIGRSDRVANLHDLGGRLLKDWDGNFLSLALAADGSIVDFARMSSTMRPFDDSLYKLTMVNAIQHKGAGIVTFHDDLLPAIDYQLLKQLLRQGVIQVNKSLKSRLINQAYLGGAEAYELRRAALVALVRMSEYSGVQGDIIDNIYWDNRGRCTDARPVCQVPGLEETCSFLKSCGRHIEMSRPLELTRHY